MVTISDQGKKYKSSYLELCHWIIWWDRMMYQLSIQYTDFDIPFYIKSTIWCVEILKILFATFLFSTWMCTLLYLPTKKQKRVWKCFIQVQSISKAYKEYWQEILKNSFRFFTLVQKEAITLVPSSTIIMYIDLLIWPFSTFCRRSFFGYFSFNPFVMNNLSFIFPRKCVVSKLLQYIQ